MLSNEAQKVTCYLKDFPSPLPNNMYKYSHKEPLLYYFTYLFTLIASLDEKIVAQIERCNTEVSNI